MTATNRTMVLGIILACYLMIILDISVIITALPDIHQGLHFSTTGLSWVQNAYALTFGGLLLLGARAGDILGRRRVFVAGIALFTAASLAGRARPVGGLAAGRARDPGRRRRDRRAVDARAADRHLPRGRRAHPRDRLVQRRRRRRRQPRPRARRHAHGLGLVARRPVHQRAHRHRPHPARAALPARDRARAGPLRPPRRGHLDARHDARIVYGFVRAASAGWGDRLTVALVRGRASALLAAFVVTERRAEQPITPLRLFRSRERSGAYVARILVVSGMYAMFFFLTQYFQGARGLQPAPGRGRLPAHDRCWSSAWSRSCRGSRPGSGTRACS